MGLRSDTVGFGVGLHIRYKCVGSYYFWHAFTYCSIGFVVDEGYEGIMRVVRLHFPSQLRSQNVLTWKCIKL